MGRDRAMPHIKSYARCSRGQMHRRSCGPAVDRLEWQNVCAECVASQEGCREIAMSACRGWCAGTTSCTHLAESIQQMLAAYSGHRVCR